MAVAAQAAATTGRSDGMGLPQTDRVRRQPAPCMMCSFQAKREICLLGPSALGVDSVASLGLPQHPLH